MYIVYSRLVIVHLHENGFMRKSSRLNPSLIIMKKYTYERILAITVFFFLVFYHTTEEKSDTSHTTEKKLFNTRGLLSSPNTENQRITADPLNHLYPYANQSVLTDTVLQRPLNDAADTAAEYDFFRLCAV